MNGLRSRSTEIAEFANDLNRYVKREFSYRKNFAEISRISNTILVQSVRVHLYLRYKVACYPGDSVVIARIAFAEQRSGRGRDFLHFLVSIADRYGLKHVVIESANEASAAFARKYGFKQLGSDDARHYTCAIQDVRESLSDLQV